MFRRMGSDRVATASYAVRPAPTALALPVALAALALFGCAGGKPTVEEAPRSIADKLLARLLAKGEVDQAQKACDSLAASKEPSEREIAAYWKSLCWLYRDEPDSALTILEPNQNKWTGSMRKVHAAIYLRLARESSLSRSASRLRHEEPAARPVAVDKSGQERLDALQKENVDLRAENTRLEAEKEKYQKLLKDLETIR